MGIGLGLLWAVIFAVIAAVLAGIRGKNQGWAAGSAFAATFILVLIEDWAIHTRPLMTFPGLLPLILANIVTVMLVCWILDLGLLAAGEDGALSAGTVVPLVALIVFGGIWIGGHGSGHGLVPCPSATAGIGGNGKACPVEAYGIVHVNENPAGTLPASVTTNLVVVSPDEAATKASQAMSSGLAGTQNFASYLHLGPATLQMINQHMWYAFPLEGKLHGVSPGYILVSGEDPGAPAIPQFAPASPNASMTVILAGGQGSEPDRWARSHGYAGYMLDNPTLEIPDGSADPVPYWTVTLMSPKVGWTFFAPVGVLLINAHTGQITRYGLPGRTAAASGGYPPAPAWIDRVYSQSVAATIGDWYGQMARRAWGGTGYTSRYQVSGSPIMVYTGDGNPSWRMLLTSYGSDVSAYRILEMDAATGAIQVYTPALPMGIESSAAAAFCNASGIGASNVRANHLIPEAMTLHIIDGTLVWMTSYESSSGQASSNAPDQQEGDDPDPCGNGEAPIASPTFTGIGFVPAYAVQSDNVVFGATRSQALANLATQLATKGSANGNAPGAGATTVTVTGTIAGIRTDVSGGNETYYLTLAGPGGKPAAATVYAGTSAVSPELVLASPGDHVTIKILRVTAGPGVQQVQAFSDAQHPVAAAGA